MKRPGLSVGQVWRNLTVGLGSVAPVRHADELTLTPGAALSTIEIVNVSNRERWAPLVLAAERRRLHVITGRSEWRLGSE